MSLDGREVIYLSSEESDFEGPPEPIPQSMTPSDLRRSENAENGTARHPLVTLHPSSAGVDGPKTVSGAVEPELSRRLPGNVIDLTDEVPDRQHTAEATTEVRQQVPEVKAPEAQTAQGAQNAPIVQKGGESASATHANGAGRDPSANKRRNTEEQENYHTQSQAPPNPSTVPGSWQVDSSPDITYQDTTYVDNTNTHSARSSSPPVASDVAQSELENPLDDDIMILDPTEAAKMGFKQTSFHQRPNTFGYPSEVEVVSLQGGYNQPAPVQHHDGTHQAATLSDSTRIMQLQLVRAHHMREIQELQRRSQALESTLQLEQRHFDEAASRAVRLEQELQAGRTNSSTTTEQLYALENRAQSLLESYRTLNQRRGNFTHEIRRVHALVLRLQEVVRQLEVDLNRIMVASTHQESHQAPVHQGYVGNIYGGRDDVDLKDLLNNIRPDEDSENDDMAATPPELAITLLKHQRMGLTWLLRMEESNSKGSILADDMGLGKTIQALSLIVAHKSTDSACKTTLVVAPVALLRQWAAELDSKLKSSYRFKIAIYHGNEKRQMTRFRDLKNFDVVMTSYGTLSSEWKKHYKSALEEALVSRGQNVVPDLDSGGQHYESPFFARDAVFYRVILDEAQNIKNKNAIASKAVYCIKALYRLCLSGTPIQNNLDELYPILRFLRIKPYNDELKFRTDIVIPLKLKSGYHDVFAERRSMKKLQALLRAILLRRAKDSLIDGEPLLSLPEKHVDEMHVDMETEEKAAYDRLEHQIQSKAENLLMSAGLTTSILTLLLRLRQACCHSFLVQMGTLKRRAEEDPSVVGIASWQRMYQQIGEFSDETVNRIKFELRDDLVKDESEPEPKEEDDCKYGAQEGLFTCPLCYDVFSRESIMLFPGCGHMICENCVDNFFERFEVGDSVVGFRIALCFSCSKEIKESQMIRYEMFHKVHFDGYTEKDVMEEFAPKTRNPKKSTAADIVEKLIDAEGGFVASTKIQKCLELVDQIRQKSLDEKIIVFSQFTSLFDLMKLVFEKKGVPFLRYDGSMSLDTRNDTIKNFYQSDVQVLLISLRAGNVGLTLTCANHVILMDPFWNPFVEEQAMDRAHRIGQQREVFVHRILINGTIENRIMELQQYKKDLVQNALDENGMKLVSRLGRQELGFLFGLNDLPDRAAGAR